MAFLKSQNKTHNDAYTLSLLCERVTNLKGQRACTRRYCIGKDQSNCSTEGKERIERLAPTCNRMYAVRGGEETHG